MPPVAGGDLARRRQRAVLLLQSGEPLHRPRRQRREPKTLSLAGRNADVAVSDAPIAFDGRRVGGRGVETALDGGLLAARKAGEHRPTGAGIIERGVEEGLDDLIKQARENPTALLLPSFSGKSSAPAIC